MTETTIWGFEKFGWRERKMAAELLNAMVEQGLPEGFGDYGVNIQMNCNSGYVFIVNSEYQVAMMNRDKLEIYHSMPYSGDEGFANELREEYDQDWNQEDVEYLHDCGIITSEELEIWENGDK